ncbi:nucleoside monophosphate kinase [Candidatus Micrarchaeota archaeon]|nr:nucleoside monophosphate kinase [Candidatus Micrarchaeota archaeon]MBU1930969.1 nucleoside monophosphate kinase [Candidatus Micrarchaeota archaeon]
MYPIKKGSKPQVFVVLGRGGAGKTEVSSFYAKKYGLSVIPLAQYIRSLANAGDTQGKKGLREIKAGEYFDGLPFLKRYVQENPGIVQRGFILDGFPRRLGDVKPFEDFLREQGFELGRIIHFQVTPQISGKRQSQRKRETPKTIKARQQSFEEKEAQVLAQYKKRKMVSVLETNPNRRVSVGKRELSIRNRNFLQHHAAKMRKIVKTRQAPKKWAARK